MEIKKRDILAAVESDAVRKSGYTRSDVWSVIEKAAGKQNMDVGSYLLTSEGQKLNEAYNEAAIDMAAPVQKAAGVYDRDYAPIADAAGRLMAADPKLSEADAVYKALDESPHLYAEYSKRQRAKQNGGGADQEVGVEMECPGCGELWNSGEKFCPDCGEKLVKRKRAAA